MASVRMENVIRDHLVCSICLEQLKCPKLIPGCMHTICCDCLDNWAKTRGNVRCPCPECTAPFDMPEGGAKNLKSNYKIASILEALNKTKATKREKFCNLHPNEAIKFYCTICHVPYCRDCAITEHNGLKGVDIAEAVAQDMTDIRTLIDTARTREKEIETLITATNLHAQNIEKNANVVNARIESARQTQIEKVNRHYDALKVEVTNMKRENINKLHVHIRSLKMNKEKFTNERKHLEIQHKDAHPSDILNMRGEIGKKKREWAQPHDQEFKSTIIRYDAGGETETGLQFGGLSSLQMIGKVPPRLHQITILENGKMVTAHGKDGINIVDPLTFTVNTHNDVECYRLTSIGNEIIAVDYKSKNIRLLNETGKDIRTVDCVSGVCAVAASPQMRPQVLAVIHSGGKKLSLIDFNGNTIQSTCEIKRDGHVQFMVMNSKNVAITSNTADKTVVGYSKEGEIRFTASMQNLFGHDVENRGLCFDPDGNIMVACNNSIYLLSPSGKLIKTLIGEEDNIKGPMDITFDGDNRVIACHCGELYRITYSK